MSSVLVPSIPWNVAEQHPLKQGLKRCVPHGTIPRPDVAEQHPLKQGLKPVYSSGWGDNDWCRRAASTKTRIETGFHVYEWEASVIGVAEQHPLKQGLKLCKFSSLIIRSASRRAASTKTRIETTLRMPGISQRCNVAEQHPLKQGLKHGTSHSQRAFPFCRRAASTKTRIETHMFAKRYHRSASRRAASTKTRIETVDQRRLTWVKPLSQSSIH